MPAAPIFLILAFALLLYMSAWFIFGFLYLRRLDSLDSAWGLGFVYIAFIALLITQNYQLISLLSLLLVTAWGFRLSFRVTARNMRKSEDERYAVYRRKFAGNLNALVFIRLFLAQGALIFLISFAMVAIIVADDFNKPLAYTGLVIWAFAVVFEPAASRIAKNRLGGIIVWIGAGIVAVSAGQYWGLIGLVAAYLSARASTFALPPKH
jgi:steroid 5-alpha reductase family enzyme